MSTTVDERVVEMKFDNADFEKNVSTSMSTLDKLKQSLDFSGSAKGFDQLTKAANSCDVSSLGSAADAVAVKFSALQVVATTALANITNSAISAGTQLLKSLSVDNISAGWEKFGSKTTSVGTLVAQGYDIDTVSEQLERLNWYTDETSYNFTDMVANIAKFTASGQDLETSVTAMEGIANWAALSGQNATTASQAMYQLAQAMSAGYMRLEDYKSIQNASMDTEEFRQKCIDAGVALGTLKDNADGTYTSIVDGATETTFSLSSFTTSLTQGAWLTSDLMMEVFNEYSGAVDQIYEYSEEKGITASEAIEELGDSVDEFGLKAFKSAQEARTWADVVDSVKDAVSTGWMNTFELLIGNYEEATAVWTELANTLYDVFAAGGETRNELLEEALSGSSWSDLESQIEETGVAASDFESELTKVAKSYGVLTDEMIDEAGSLEATLSQGWLSTNLVAEALRNLAGGEATVSGSTEDLTEQLEEFQNVVNAVIKGTYGNGQDRVEALAEAGYDYATIQGLVNKQLKNGSISVSDLSDAELENLGYTEDEIKAIKALAEEAETTGSSLEELINGVGKMSGRELLIDSIRNIGTAILNFGGAIKEAWNEIFPSMTASGLYSMLESFHEFTSSLVKSDKTLKKVTKAFKGLFSIVHLFSSLVGGVLKIGMTAIYTIIDAVDGKILNFAANVGDAITGVHDWIYENELFSSVISNISSLLVNGVGIVKSWVDSFTNLPLVQKYISKIQEFFTTFSSGPATVISRIKKLTSTIKTWLIQIYKIPAVNSVITTVTTTFYNAFLALKEYFSGGIEAILEFIDYVKSFDGVSLDNIGEIFHNFMTNVVGYFTDIHLSIDDVTSALKDFKDTALGYLDSATGGLDGVKGKLQEFLDFIDEKFNINSGSLLTMAFGGGIVMFALLLDKLTTSVTKKVKSFVNAVNPFADVMSGVKSALTSFAKEVKAQALLTQAAAIFVVAAAVYMLAQLESDKLIAATGAIIILAGAMTGLSILLTKVTKTNVGTGSAKNAIGIAALFIGFAGAIIAIAGAAKMIQGMNAEELFKSFAFISTMIAVLTTALTAMNGLDKFTAGSGVGAALAMLSIAIAVKMLAGALNDIPDFSDIDSKLGSIITIVGTLAILMKAANGVGAGGGIAVLGIAIALRLMVSAFDAIADFDVSKVQNNLGSFILIIGTLALLMVASKAAGANAASAGVGILAMSVALNLIVLAMKGMASMEASNLERAKNVVLQLLGMFTLLEAFSAFSGANAMKAGVMLMSASVGILLISAAMAILANLPEEGLQRAIEVVMQLGIMFMGLITASYFAQDCKGTMIVLAVTIGLLAASLGALSMIESSSLRAAANALTQVMAVFAAMEVLTKFTQTGKSTIAALAVMTVVVAALARILYLLASSCSDNGSLYQSAYSLSMLVAALSVLMAALGTIKSVDYGSVAAVAGIAVVVAALSAVILGLMDFFNVDAEIETVGSLCLLILSLSAACVLLGAAGKLGASVTSGVIAFTALVAGIAAIMAALGGIDMLTDGSFSTALDNAISLFEKIGEAIGSFVSGIGVGLTSSLPDMGTNLSTFMTNIGDFIEGVNGIDEGFAAKASSLVSAISSFMGASFSSSIMSSISSLFGNDSSDMSTLKTELVTFGEAIKGYSDAVTGIDVEAVEASADAIDALANLQNGLTRSGGFLQDLLGTKMDLGTFGENLTSFAEAIVGYSEAVSAEGAIDKDAVEKSADAAQILSDLAQGLPSTGGKMQWFLGEKDLGKFGEQLSSFAAGLVAYSAIITGKSMCFVNNQGFVGPIDSEAISKSVDSATLLSNLANGLPSTGGMMAEWFFGEKNLEDFGKQLASFGGSLVAYSSAITEGDGIDNEAIENSTTAATKLSDLANALPEGTGLFEKLTTGGDNVSLSTFGSQLSSFATALAKFDTDTSDVDWTNVKNSATYTTRLVTMAETVCGAAISTNNTDIFKTAVSSISTAISNFDDKVGDVDVLFINQFSTSFSSLVDTISSISGINSDSVSGFVSSLDSLSGINFEGLTSGMSSYKSNITTAVSDMLSATLSTGIDSKQSAFQAAGSNLMAKLVTGMNLKATTVKSAATSIVTGTYATMQTYRNKFYTTGLYLVEGFASGITQNTYKAKAAAAAMAKKANEAAQAALDENSPSKEGYKTGAYYGEGFTNGIISFINTAYSTGADLANAAKDGLNRTVSTVASMVEDSLNAEPVIAPVLDLSNVQAGMQTVSGMFTDQTLSVNPTPAYQVSNMMSRIQNRSTDADVVSAIRKLGTDLSSRTGDTYNVNGVTYDDGSNITDAVKTIVRVARIERRT